MPAWRARAFHLTRSRTFLAKAVAVILGVCALIAVLLHISRQDSAGQVAAVSDAKPDVLFKAIVRDGAHRLAALSKPAPHRLIAWLRSMAAHWVFEEGVSAAGFDSAALRLAGVELYPLLEKHSTSPAQGEAIAAYTRLRFLPQSDARNSAFDTLNEIARQTPEPHVHEMLGDALLINNQRMEALQAYVREIGTPEASYARRCAVELALSEKAVETLRLLCADKRVIEDSNPALIWLAAKQTGDRRMLFSALVRTQWARWVQGAELPLALLAAAIWYIILVHTASREAFRWWRYLPAIFAGVASTWMLKWWQGTLNYYREPEAEPSMTHELISWIARVGLPEEAAKLLLFAFFLPVLLHQRSAVKAALTAGCVGLGFALNENLAYFRDEGPDKGLEVAIGRLLTANFLHVSFTGILGWHLYELFRSRFHHATGFLTAFAGVVVAHGIYDFSTGNSAMAWGFNVAGIMILAFSARIYLHTLHENERIQPAGYAISRTSVFCLGTALLGGLLMIVLVWESRSLTGITSVLKSMVSLAIVGLFYIREWRELN